MMQFTVRSALAGSEAFEGWVLTSRAVAVGNSDRICSLVADAVSPLPEGREFAAKHRSRALAPEHARLQQLIVVAGRPERSALARMAPEARSRTFTLREATLLGEGEPDSCEVALARELLAENPRDLLSPYASMLNRRRGLVPLPEPTWRSRWRRDSDGADVLDLPDDHGSTPRRHVETVRQTKEEARWFASQLIRFAHVVTLRSEIAG